MPCDGNNSKSKYYTSPSVHKTHPIPQSPASMAHTSTPLTKETNDTMHTGPTNARSIRYLDTASAYDLWASVYDTDGNFLQALDSIEMKMLLPRAMSMLTDTQNDSPTTKIKAVDLGCGTGRNTLG